MFDRKAYMKEWNKKYRQEHKEYFKEYSKQWKNNNKEHCAEYSKEYKKKYNKELKEYSKKYSREHRDCLREKTREWRSKNRDRVAMWGKKKRMEVLNIVSNNNIVCDRCGCNDIRLLEINHKNGGGSKETKRGKSIYKFYAEIINGKRKTNDLELLCKVCNAWHYLELKYGELPYKIYYKKEEENKNV